MGNSMYNTKSLIKNSPAYFWLTYRHNKYSVGTGNTIYFENIRQDEMEPKMAADK